jgi:hypothetical protein
MRRESLQPASAIRTGKERLSRELLDKSATTSSLSMRGASWQPQSVPPAGPQLAEYPDAGHQLREDAVAATGILPRSRS